MCLQALGFVITITFIRNTVDKNFLLNLSLLYLCFDGLLLLLVYTVVLWRPGKVIGAPVTFPGNKLGGFFFPAMIFKKRSFKNYVIFYYYYYLIPIYMLSGIQQRWSNITNRTWLTFCDNIHSKYNIRLFRNYFWTATFEYLFFFGSNSILFVIAFINITMIRFLIFSFFEYMSIMFTFMDSGINSFIILHFKR